jgi:hypothetical protein
VPVPGHLGLTPPLAAEPISARAPCQDDKGKKVIEDGPSDAPVHALDSAIYNPLSYNGPTNTPMLQLSEDAAQAPFKWRNSQKAPNMLQLSEDAVPPLQWRNS